MLSFDPEERISVVEALEHPWLASYHDVKDEPACPTPYNKWQAIEKLETIEDFRTALWNEIQEYRREVRSIGIEMPYQSRESSPHRAHAVTDAGAQIKESRPSTPPPGIFVQDGQAAETESSTAVEEGEGGKNTFDDGIDDAQEKTATNTATTDTATPTANPTAVQSPATAPLSSSLRPGVERRDSMRPPTPADMQNDPVVHYARRSSILQAQYMQAGSSSVSPVRRMVGGMPAYEELREGLPYAPTPPPVASAYSFGAAGGPVGSIPFPTTGAGSYIVPARSRTASTVGGDYGSGFFGARKLLRTLSTVSIHESVEGHAGGLAGMGPMGQAIIERRETAADAPPSEMPRDFGTVREEEDSDYRTGSGHSTGYLSRSGANSAGPSSPEKKGSSNSGGKATPSSSTSTGEVKGGSSGNSTPSKKKEKRFIIF